MIDKILLRDHGVYFLVEHEQNDILQSTKAFQSENGARKYVREVQLKYNDSEFEYKKDKLNFSMKYMDFWFGNAIKYVVLGFVGIAMLVTIIQMIPRLL
jgi:hypothetical protein